MIVVVACAKSPRMATYVSVIECLATLFACAGLLTNSLVRNRRTRAFWLLLSFSCIAWFLTEAMRGYLVVMAPEQAIHPGNRAMLLFFHLIPMMGALALTPHANREDLTLRIGYVDLSLILVWWLYLYILVVIPWQFVVPNSFSFRWSYGHLIEAECIVLAIGFAALLIHAKGAWRIVYCNLFAASALLALEMVIRARAIAPGTSYSGASVNLLRIIAFLWYGTAGLVAYRLKPGRQEAPEHTPQRNAWPARIAILTVISIPLATLWTLRSHSNQLLVRNFRAEVSQLTLIVAAVLLFCRRHLVDTDRVRLLRAAHESLENLKRFQAQMVRAEKMVSLGQLAAGAAHEINNPLTGILGYSDMLADDSALDGRHRASASKIRELARRINAIVTSLLSFARRVPMEKSELDLNLVISNALSLNRFDPRRKAIKIETIFDQELPHVYGDPSQMLQLFFNLTSNAFDSLEECGGGSLIVRTESQDGKIKIEFSDSGRGIQSPERVFDPFFTTKPAGKGTGLGLSICYGIVHEHGGRIGCFNRPEGGATFLVELPADTNKLSFPAPERPTTIASQTN